MLTLKCLLNGRNVVFVYLLCFLSLSACKKPGDILNTPDTPYGNPVITEKGNPVGPAVIKTIDAAGGELISGDGKLKISVPPGTVAAATAFSIQPITNTLHENRTAYRLLPEGTTFSKPVELSYHYADADIMGTSEDLLMLLFQTETGSWERMRTRLNKTQKRLTVFTTHFSDWTAGGSLELHVRKKNLTAGESTEIRVYGAHSPGNEEFSLAPLIPTGSYFDGFITKIGDWKVLQGSGSVTGKPSASHPNVLPEATYKAPAAISQTETVTIQVEIEGNMNIDDPVDPTFDRKIRKVILLGEIKLLSDVHMIIDFEGTTVINDVSAIYGNGSIGIQGASADVTVVLRANGNSTGVYACGGVFDPLASQASISVNPTSSSNRIYITSYIECGPPRIERYSPGNLKITKWGNIGETVEGEFNGTVYSESGSTGNCPQYLQKNLRVQFRAIRSI